MSAPLVPSPCARAPRWLLGFVLGVTVLAFIPTLTGGFLADDFVYVPRFRELPWSEWPKLFTHEWSGGVWGQPLREVRPFAALSFISDARLFGGSPLGYRLTNLALHLFATFFILQLAWYYSGGKTAAAAFTGLMFGLHPAHAEAVAWITGRVDLLAAAAGLLYWLTAEFHSDRGHPRHLIVAWLALFLGVFAKEFCTFVPLLLALRWLLLDLPAGRTAWRRRLVLLAGSVVIVVAYAACRRAALGHDSIGYNMWTDEPAWHRQMSYAGWIVPLLPFTSLAEWQAFPSLATLHAVWAVIAAAIVLGLVFALRRRARIAALALFFGGVWYLLLVTPLTGVVYHSPRHVYFFTAGLALALGLACGGAGRRGGRAFGVVLVFWCVVGHVAAIRPWLRAGHSSRVALAALDRALAEAGPTAVAISSVPATLGPAWMWAWSSPQCFAPPFLAHPPAKILEHPVNYSRSGPWYETRQPLETVRAATALVVLYVDPAGRVSCRQIPAAELTATADSLAQTIARGISPESWNEWVKSIAVR